MRDVRSILLLVFLLLLFPGGAIADSVFQQGPLDEASFYDTAPENILAQPTEITANTEGGLMIWDRGLREFVYLNLDDYNQQSVLRRRNLSESKLYQQLEVHQVSQWLSLPDPVGFWGSDGSFWLFKGDTSSSTETVWLESVHSNQKQKLPVSSLKSILLHDSYWIVQPDSGPLVKWDPASEAGLVDTGPSSIRGKLFAINDDGQYFTHSQREIRVYDGNAVEHSRIFQNFRAVSKQGDFLYVLNGQNKVQKLDTNLSVQFTFRIPGDYRFNDLALRGNTLYLIGNEGLYRTQLDGAQKSFFSSSQQLNLEKILGSTPEFTSRKEHTRLWGTTGGQDKKLYLKKRSQKATSVDFSGTSFEKQNSVTSLNELPLNAFQYFQSGSTFWNGNNRLYYFFPDEKTVEAYDRNNQIIRRTQVEFDEFDSLRNVQFLGADRQRILFEGDVIYPRLGFRRSVFVFTWDGNLTRVFRLHQPSPEPYTDAVNGRKKWRYDGEGRIYVLGSDYVQQFDLWGYPGQTIQAVIKPVDLMKIGDNIAVLDLNGQRVRLFKSPEKRHYRFGSPLNRLSVSNVESTRSNQFILSGSESPDDRHEIMKYDPKTLQFQTVFRHPNRSLNYPEVSEDGDTLFIWGKRASDRQYRLFVSDLTQFAARPTNVKFDVGGSGIHDGERDIYLVPRESASSNKDSGDTQFYYVTGDRRVKELGNSGSLRAIDRGGFTGYYGVEETDEGHALVSGYLERISDTGNWSWNTSDTIMTTPHEIQQILHKNGRLFLALSPRPGFTLLGSINPDRPGDDRADHFFRLRGQATWIKPGASKHFVLHKSAAKDGNIAMVFPSKPETGGVQGNIVTSSPADLEGVNLRTDPGGIRFKTESGGAFSVDGLPIGYLRFMTESYKKFFSYPARTVVQPGEFDLLGDVSIEIEDELLLLERGLGYFNDGEYRRSRIALEAYRDLIEEGPYYRMASIFLKEIYQRQGDAKKLFELYQKFPTLFEPSARHSLYEVLTDPKRRYRILSDFKQSFKPFLNRLFTYQLNHLRSTFKSGEQDAGLQQSYRHFNLTNRSGTSAISADTQAERSP